jgi:hypothetical protein
MTKEQFKNLLEKLSFDDVAKDLMLTSYMVGYDKGKIDGLSEAIAIAEQGLHKNAIRQ